MSDFKHYTDEELLGILRSDQKAAFEEIFERYWYSLYKTARRSLQSHEEAEEIVQELFTHLWQNRIHLRVLNLSAYLHGAVRKRVIDKIRSKLVVEKYWHYYNRYRPDYQEDTEHTVIFNELNEQIEEAMQNLPEKSRQIFRLNRLEGLSVREIASALKLSERAIEYHLTKSLRLVKSHLRDFILLLLLLSQVI